MMSIILAIFQLYGITNSCMYSIKSCVRLFNATRSIFVFSISIEMSYGPRGFEDFNLEMMFSTSLDVKEMFSESLNEILSSPDYCFLGAVLHNRIFNKLPTQLVLFEITSCNPMVNDPIDHICQ